MCKNEIIFKLYKLLDDIDTASDMFKDDYEGLAKYVYRKQRERFDVVSQGLAKKLYDKYYEYPQDYILYVSHCYISEMYWPPGA